jgi:uncharacterized protein (TIGR00369 family)
MERETATEPAEVWSEPVRGGYPDPGVLSLSGLERLRSWRKRGFPPPPLYHLTGAAIAGVGTGTAAGEMPASGWLAASNGLITGGTLAMVADIAFGCAVETELPAATTYTTAELSMSFLRPVKPDGMLSAHGQAIHAGRSVGLSEAFVLDGERLVAHGTSRLAMFPPLEGLPDPPPESGPFEPPPSPTPDPFLREPPRTQPAPEVWNELSGLEILRKQLAGELPRPPLHYLTGIEPVEVGDGAARVRMPASEWLASPTRTIQGGTIAMMADFAMLVAVQTTTGPGVATAGLDVKVNYLRPGIPDGRDLTAIAEIIHRGRTLAIARCEVSNADGKPIAIATGSAMHLPGRAADLGGDLELSGREDEG